jgi:DtxR family Mn-dependent transcriptional regulator
LKISPIMQEYLGEIYRLERSPEGVTTSALAERLDVSPPAVVRMLRRLDEAGLLTHIPYQGVKLSQNGEREALRSIRRHRLLEAFLVKVMGFGWDEVHDESHKLELAISDAFEDRMDAVSGHPTRCPHGDPIPTKDGRMPEVNDQPLLGVPVGTVGTVSRVKTHDGEKLRYLAKLGLIPGTSIRLLNRAPFNGPLRLQVEDPRQGANGHEHVIGTELAQALRVEVAP